MQILLTIAGVLIGIILLILIIALFSKKDYSIQREIIINQPVETVFNYIRHLKNQDNFNKWVMTDPTMTKSFRGQDGTVGFVYAWEGNNQAGKGEQEIVNLVPNQRVDAEIRFEKPFEAIAKAPFITTSIGEGQTKLVWGMDSSMKYPMNAMLLFMNMDKLLGKDLEISLARLKEILEKNP